MQEKLTSGAVIFVANTDLVARFYEELASLTRVHEEPGLVVLQSDSTQLVIHALAMSEPSSIGREGAPKAREDSYIKLYFPVQSLAEVRARVENLGGWLAASSMEWHGRGFRACEGTDPEGNVVQFREREPAQDQPCLVTSHSFGL